MSVFCMAMSNDVVLRLFSSVFNVLLCVCLFKCRNYRFMIIIRPFEEFSILSIPSYIFPYYVYLVAYVANYTPYMCLVSD
jgi:hypothetical protein